MTGDSRPPRRQRFRFRRRGSEAGRSAPSSLLHLRPGDRATVLAIETSDRARLERLSALGLTPGASITLRQRQPAVIIGLGETELALDHAVAALVRVHRTDPLP